MNATANAIDESSPPMLALILMWLGQNILRLWDHLTQTPTQFSFVFNPDRSKVGLVMYCYDPEAFHLVKYGVIMDRGAAKFDRYNGRALRRLLAAAYQAGLGDVKYIERPATSLCVWTNPSRAL